MADSRISPVKLLSTRVSRGSSPSPTPTLASVFYISTLLLVFTSCHTPHYLHYLSLLPTPVTPPTFSNTVTTHTPFHTLTTHTRLRPRFRPLHALSILQTLPSSLATSVTTRTVRTQLTTHPQCRFITCVFIAPHSVSLLDISHSTNDLPGVFRPERV